MKRLGTTPRRRPTVACQPTIGHRTPKTPVKRSFEGTDYVLKWIDNWTDEDLKAFQRFSSPPHAPPP